MSHAHYLKHYHANIKALVKLGLPAPRRVWWQLTPQQAKRYNTQINAMRAARRKMAGSRTAPQKGHASWLKR